MSARLRLPRLSVSLFLCLFVLAGAFAADAHAGALTPSAKWMDELFQAEAFNGAAVDGAGDINRDGYDDVIVGAPLYDTPNTAAGMVRIFLGTSTGVNPTAAWIVTGPGGTGGEFGTAVAGAGDVNGDGYTDILVSAVGDDLTCCYNYQGTVYLYLGTATGVSTTPARSYGPGGQGFIYFGTQITALGDVNRDGFADFAIGSRGYTNGQSSEGAVFIYYGAATPPSAASLVIEGNVSSELMSWSGRAGDVNGDTYPDVIVRGASKVQIHYGSATGLSSSPSWSAAASAVASSGFSPVAGAGDVNNDGFDDVLVSDFIDNGVGRVHLFLGSASGPATTPAMTLVSPFPTVAYGGGIAGIGDVDGDGYDDVVITAAGWSNGQTGEGRAFLHRGGPGGLSSSFAWTAESNYASGSLGKVAAAGDINNDGLADVILGATGYANHGAAYVYFGSTVACTPPAAPSSLVVTATANAELTLNWTTVAGAHHYVIYRALAACGSGTYARVGETESNIGTYVDKTALPGGLYSYVVKSATQANVCESDPGPCDDETSTGTCTAKPLFTGLDSATSTDCGTVLAWTAATSGCPVPGNVRYHVYRDTSSTFTPSASTRIASCVSGTSYIAQMNSGGPFYYIVRAEENGCARTNEETNIVRKSGSTVLDFFDNMENPRTPAADARFLTTGQAVRTTCKTYAGTYAYRLGGSSLCNSYNNFENATLVVGGNGSFDPNINGFRIPTGWTNVQLTFQNYFNSVSGRDGAFLQYSTTSATGPWTSVPTGTTANSPYIISGGYNGTILSGSVPAWTGTNTFFNTVTVNLNAVAGNQVWFRFLWQTSGSASLTSAGFYIDEIRVSGNSTSLQSVSIATGGSTAFCANASGPVVTATPNGGGPWAYDWGYRSTPGGPVTTLSSARQQTYTPFGGNFPGPGTYYLVSMVTPNCGGLTVSNELTLTVSAVPSTPAITPSGPTTFCTGGSVTLTAPAGFTYLWAPGGEATQSIVVTNPGSYTVRVTAAGGCNATSAPTVVTVNAPPPTTITPSGPTTFCAGGSVTLTAPAAASWLWSTGETTQSIVVNTTGSYTVAVTSANGCSATSAATAVTVNPAEAVPTIEAGGATTFCAGGSVTLTSSEAASYLWSNGATTRSIEVTAAGSYSVTVRNANGCSATSAATAVTVNALPAVAISASGPTTFCEGGSVTLTASEAASYLWSNGATTQSIDVSSSGSFNVTVMSTEGCSATSAATAVTVNAPPAATIAASGPATFCEGGSVTLTASAGASWLWSTGATTQSIDVAASGSYSVTVTNASGCSATSAATAVTVNALPSATISASGATTFCEGGSVTLTAGDGASYLWSNGATTQSIEVTASGSYTVTVTSASGCSATSGPAVVTVNAVPAATISASGPTTFCEGGSVTLTAAAGASYVWSTGATTQAIQVTSSGSYSVTVSSAAGCSATSASTAVTVNALPAATISASGPTTFCEGGSVTLTASDGTSWLWSTGATSQSISVSASGSYSVTVTNAAGCSTASAPTAVTVNANPAATITASGPTTFCEGGSVTLTASAGASWLWSNGATTQSISVSTSGSSSVIVTNAAGCSTTSDPTVTTVNANPSATIAASGPTTFCAGGSVTLTASAGASWLWSNGATSQSIEVTGSGSYSVIVTNAAGCSTTSAATAVAVNATPAATIAASGPTTFCEGGSVTLTASAGASWLWSNGATTQSIAANSTGSYSVTVTNASGCSATSPATQVTVNPLPAATISASGPTTFCAGGSVTLTASAGSSYSWSNGATTQSIAVSTTGNYSVTVTNGSGCSTTSSATSATVNPMPSATVTAGGATTFCEGGSVTLTASAGASWLWSNGATTQAINVTQSGSYSVAVTNASGCTATSAATAVTVNPMPTPAITASGPTNLCGGSVTLTGQGGSGKWYRDGAFVSAAQSIVVQFSSGSYVFQITSAAGCTADSAPVQVTYTPSYTSVTASSQICWNQQGTQKLNGTQPGSTFVWTATGGTIVSGQGTAEVVYAAEAGSNNVRLDVTITQPSGCARDHTFNIQVDGSMKPAVTAQGPTTFCPGGSVTLDGGTAPSGYTYLWSTGATTQSIAASVAGSYTVRYRRTFTGCLSTPSDPIVITVDTVTPTITAGGPTTFCTGGSVTLTASAGSSWLWSTGATTQSINVSTSGSYTVTVTNANGCSGTSGAKSVTVNPLPAATITAGGPTTFCAGGSVTLTASAGSSYLWSNGATTSSIAATTTGNYSVTVTNANGCSATSAPTSVTVNPLPAATITAGGPTTFCTGGSVTLIASAGSSYLWSTGATTSSIAVTTTGNYSVTVTNASGCSTTSSATAVTVNAKPAATITAGGPTTFCTGGSVTLTSSAGSSYLWSTGATTSSIVVSASGSYTVTVTNAAGCSTTSSPTAVTVNAKPGSTIGASGPTTFCTGGSVTLTAPAGTSYAWSTGATSASIVVSIAGSYGVTVTNAAGCSTAATPVTVVVNAKPATPTITPSGPTTFCPGGSVTLTAPAGFTYLWSTGATTQSIAASAAGNYTVTVTNGSGCSTTSAATTVTLNAATAITVQQANKTIAKNTSTTLSVTATGTNLTYQLYRGNVGVTTTPVGSQTSNPSLSTGVLAKGTYTFWIKVFGTCGNVNGNAITVTAN